MSTSTQRDINTIVTLGSIRNSCDVLCTYLQIVYALLCLVIHIGVSYLMCTQEGVFHLFACKTQSGYMCMLSDLMCTQKLFSSTFAATKGPPHPSAPVVCCCGNTVANYHHRSSLFIAPYSSSLSKTI